MNEKRKVSILSTSASGALFTADTGEEEKDESRLSGSPKKRIQSEINTMGKSINMSNTKLQMAWKKVCGFFSYLYAFCLTFSPPTSLHLHNLLFEYIYRCSIISY